MAKFWSSYWQPFQCPACDGLSVPDAKKYLAFPVLAVAPLLALLAVVWALPGGEWIGTFPNWSIALAIMTVVLGYFVGVVWVLVVNELKRTCRLETKAVNIACLGQLIRSLRVHVPPHRQIPAGCVQYH